MSKKRKILSIIFSVLIVLTLFFIWGNSIVPKAQSKEQSDSVYNSLQPFLNFIFGGGKIDAYFLRKLAHLFEFFVLGLESSILLTVIKGVKLKWFLVIIPFGILVGVIDEVIQIFSNRGAMVLDVLIDSAGYLLALIIFYLIAFLICKKKTK